ncbi:MAG: hypothetical protein P1P65_07520 [Treponema sp.]
MFHDTDVAVKRAKSYEQGLYQKACESARILKQLHCDTDKIEKTKSQLMYYSVKDLLKHFFEKWNIEDQRNHLLRVIDNAILTDNILKIKTEEFKFIFDINKKYTFPDDIYKEVLEDVGNDIDMESLKMKNGENVFNQFMWTVLAESMIKGICVYEAKEKTIKFI